MCYSLVDLESHGAGKLKSLHKRQSQIIHSRWAYRASFMEDGKCSEGALFAAKARAIEGDTFPR